MRANAHKICILLVTLFFFVLPQTLFAQSKPEQIQAQFYSNVTNLGFALRGDVKGIVAPKNQKNGTMRITMNAGKLSYGTIWVIYGGLKVSKYNCTFVIKPAVDESSGKTVFVLSGTQNEYAQCIVGGSQQQPTMTFKKLK